MTRAEKIKNTNLKIDNYDIIEVETFMLTFNKTEMRIFMLRILVGDEERLVKLDSRQTMSPKLRSFSKKLERELNIRLIEGHSSVIEKVSELSGSELLGLVSKKR